MLWRRIVRVSLEAILLQFESFGALTASLLSTHTYRFARICEKRYFREKDAAKLVQTICSAVEYLHKKGIVHRGEAKRTQQTLFQLRKLMIDPCLCISYDRLETREPLVREQGGRLEAHGGRLWIVEND